VNTNPRTRRIGPIGTAARLVIGVAFLAIATAVVGVGLLEILIGLVAANLAVVATLALRGRNASPLRATGAAGHCLNCALIALFFVLLPGGAFLFYGSSILIAAAAGTRGCEMLAVSNVILRRDDAIGCPLFAAIDGLDARDLRHAHAG
jgi:hypothetical protein